MICFYPVFQLVSFILTHWLQNWLLVIIFFLFRPYNILCLLDIISFFGLVHIYLILHIACHNALWFLSLFYQTYLQLSPYNPMPKMIYNKFKMNLIVPMVMFNNMLHNQKSRYWIEIINITIFILFFFWKKSKWFTKKEDMF